eukprot:TRINITY_DN307_c0_g2_i8.p1 TRINITY_DN307_c0_g2~~TRINITY_DN307_c0_g2_i8.p1  ORF type:complete len:1461 (+),score=277.86 TRINITY_DN307_c0_g2_i8:68-4450(+)
MSLLKSLQIDLRALSVESRKKNPSLKEVCERALVKLRGLEDSSSSSTTSVSDQISGMEELRQSVTQSLSTHEEKTVLLGLSVLLRLAQHSALQKTHVPLILKSILDIPYHQDDNINVKVLQIISAFVASTTAIHDEHLALALAIGFRITNTKHATIRQTAHATLRQIITAMFDKLDGPIPDDPNLHAEEAETPYVAPQLQDIILFIKDVCLLLNRNPAVWIRVTSIEESFGLDLLESILSGNLKHFQQHRHLSFLLKERIVPLVYEYFMKTHHFPITCRVARIVGILLHQYVELVPQYCAKFFIKTNAHLKSGTSSWHRVLLLEVLLPILSSPTYLLKMAPLGQHVTETSRLFEELSACLYQTIYVRIRDNFEANMTRVQKSRYVELLNDSDPPTHSDAYITSIAFELVTKLPEALYGAITQQEKDAIQKEKDLTANMILSECWKSSMQSMILLLETIHDERLVQTLLHAYQHMILAASAVEDQIAQKILLESICRLSVPNIDANHDGIQPVTFKHVLTIQRLFNIAHLLGDQLGFNWIILWQAFEHIDRIMISKTLQALVSEFSKYNLDSSIFSTNVADLLKSTVYIRDDSLINCLQSLKKLAEISSLFEPIAPAAVNAGTGIPARNFGLQKMTEAALCNIRRIGLIWDLVSSTLVSKATDSDSSIREHAVNNIIQLINGIFGYKPAEEKKSDQEEFQPKDFQNQIFATLHSIIKANYHDTNEKILQYIHQLLQLHGGVISTAWLEIISTVKENSKDASLSPRAYSIAQYIGTDFLSALPIVCIPAMVSMTLEFAHQVDDLNISLSAIGLLWSVSDFLVKIQSALHSGRTKGLGDCLSRYGKSDLSPLWLHVYSALADVCVDSRPEVRNSAFRTLFTSLATDGGSFPKQLWQEILWNILLPTFEKVHQTAELVSQTQTNVGNPDGSKGITMVVHHSRNTSQKQWNETKVAAVTGLARIIKIYITPFQDSERFPQLWAKLMDLISLAARDPSKELALVAVPCWIDVMNSLVTKSFNQDYWDQGWTTVYGFFKEPYEKNPPLRTELFVQLVESIDNLFTTSRGRFSDADIERTLDILDMMVHEVILSCPTLILKVNQLQAAILAFHAKLEPATPSIILKSYKLLIGYMLYDIECKPSDGPATPISNIRSPLLAPFPEKILVIITDLFMKSSIETKDCVIDDILLATSKLIAHKNHQNVSATTWVSSLSAFINICARGLKLLSEAEHSRSTSIWSLIIANISSYFQQESEKVVDEFPKGEELECALVTCISRDVLLEALHFDASIVDGLVQFVAKGCSLQADEIHLSDPTLTKRVFIFNCFNQLVEIIKRAEIRSGTKYYQSDLLVAKTGSHALIRSCWGIFETLAVHTNGSTSDIKDVYPEFEFVFNLLSQLQFATQVFDLDALMLHTNRTILYESMKQNTRRHLFYLYPQLTKCIHVEDGFVRSKIALLLQIIGRELGLE